MATKSREEIVKAVHEIQFIRRMLAGMDGKAFAEALAWPSFKGARDRLTALRHDLKHQEPWLKERRAKYERLNIENTILNHYEVAGSRTKTRVSIGKADPETGERNWVTYEPGYGRGDNRQSPYCYVYVGHMWRLNVYKELIKSNAVENNKLFLTEAVEYRINVPHIRLYRAKWWNKEQKEMCSGYIGRSKIGEQKAAVAGSKHMAIHYATLLVAADLDAQLKENPE